VLILIFHRTSNQKAVETMKPFIIAIATSVLATAAAASLLALPAKEVKEKKSPRRLGQTHAEPPSSSALPAEEFSEETLSRRLGMTQAESTPISDTVTYIVQFEDTAAAPGDRCKALAMANGGIVGHVYKEVVNGCSLTMPRTEVGVYSGDEIIALGDYPKVAHVEDDRTVYAFEDGEDNIFDSSSKVQTRAVAQTSLWNLDRVDQCTRPLNNQATKNSASGVKVYVLDTGIHASHEEFRGLIGPTVCHYNAVEARALTDNNGHG
jgi:subtilisin family serine protease